MTHTEIQARVVQKRRPKRRYPLLDNVDTKYYRHFEHGDEHGDSRNRFSWAKLLKLSVAFNLVNLLSLKCSVHVHCPDKHQFCNAVLSIPRICKQTVQYTFSFLMAPIRPPSTHDNYGVRGVLKTFGASKWKSRARGVTGRVRLSQVYQVIQLLRIPINPLVGFLVGPAIYAFRQVSISERREINKTKLIRKTLGWQIKCYRMMPLRTLSTAWGFVNSLNLPVFLRPIVLQWYIKMFSCNIAEAEVEDLKYYRNLGEFFRRNLKSGVRPIDTLSPIVSPADGQVLHFGKVERGLIEQVKGVTYSITQFLGPPSWTPDFDPGKTWNACEEFSQSIMHHKEGTSLFHCVIYLAPGDYHKFHSPVQWQVDFRRHFAGELLSVNPKVAKFISGLFSLNERAVYTGRWKHGFFSFTAVGATNVGSIRVYEDPELRTNERRTPKGQHQDKNFNIPLCFDKGQNIGEFNLGSTVVLIFEAPTDFTFDLYDGKRVQILSPIYTNFM